MGLLAYNPERVAFLRIRLRAAADELRAVRTDDPAACDAMRSMRLIQTEIEQVWLPLVTRILESSALTGPWWRTALSGLGLEHALVKVMSEGYGWSVQLDRLDDDASIVTAAEARALGALLNETDFESLAADRERLRWLSRQLAIIARSPALSLEFLANFHAWHHLTYVLGREHARHDRPEISGIFDGLMGMWKHQLAPHTLTASKSATLDSLLPAIEDADPYVQALMVRSLRLDAITVATLTHELLTRWLTLKNDRAAPETMDREVVAGRNAGDLLLPLLLDDPAACVWFTELMSRDPALLFETLNDPDVAYQVVLIGTDPSHTSAAAAGDAVLAILDYFRVDPYSRDGFDTDGHPGEYGAFLGSLVAPWLLQFTMVNDDWDASPGTKAALLRVALRDEDAMQRLIADTERIRAGFAASLPAEGVDAAREVGALSNLVLQLSVNELVDDEIANSDGRFNLMWAVVGVASSFLPGGPLVSIGAGIVIATLTNKLNTYLDQPDPTGVRRTAERAMDVALTLAGADAVSRLHQQWLSSGIVADPPPTVDVTSDRESCTSAEYHLRFDDWMASLPGGRDSELANDARDLLAAFVGESEAQSNCAEIAG